MYQNYLTKLFYIRSRLAGWLALVKNSAKAFEYGVAGVGNVGDRVPGHRKKLNTTCT